MTWPSRDPSIPRPGLRFYQGCWRTQEAIDRKSENRTDNARRVGTTVDTYVGMAPTIADAAMLNGMVADFAEQQKEELSTVIAETPPGQLFADPRRCAELQQQDDEFYGGVIDSLGQPAEQHQPDRRGCGLIP